MAKGDKRAELVAGAARLLAEHGPTGTSLGDVLAATGGARGSTYHHFPGGKRELYAAALDLAGSRAMEALETHRGEPARAVVERFLGLWRALLVHGHYRLGCAVLSVAVAGDSPEAVDHAGGIFRAWRAHLASLLVDGGLTEPQATALATTTIAATEGAVAMARAERDLEPFELVAGQLIAAVPG